MQRRDASCGVMVLSFGRKWLLACAGGVGGSCSSANLYAVRFSRMDAWGNLISPVYLDGLPLALPVADIDCTASTADGCEPADGMPQAEVLAGPYQYHGSDRYETDLIDMDKLLRPDGGQPAPGAGRSTGFVHVGVRYYEPATGRFLQHDPMFIDPTPFAWGQHNRWVYCANDPVNASDPSGMSLLSLAVTLILSLILQPSILADIIKMVEVCEIAHMTGLLHGILHWLAANPNFDFGASLASFLGEMIAALAPIYGFGMFCALVGTGAVAIITGILAGLIADVIIYNLQLQLAIHELFDDWGNVSPHV